ncbi:winged helix family transcriptional regulator [Streptomyces triticagri]|uniref:Winged helix family transcriptional regulator n=1 Tax=Streptomyces triticagri TaxID=2293568 RepID=A0A372M5Q6_9ACTN|nr:winged helix-turn-helix domain-containing protein [Streptomyces triticagri]RFU86266.1 winged helix family transcriptional regulator [Streptomyces triticagri]
MANTRSFSTATAPASPTTSGAVPPARHRLRAVDRDEVVNVADFLPPGATWLPAPQHTLPTLPGHPPMVGYLVLVPADQQPAAVAGRLQAPASTAAIPAAAPSAARTVPEQSAAGQGTADPLVRIDPVQRTADVDGRPLDLTYLEFELLAHLVAHPQRVHTRDHLVSTVWGYGHVGDGRTVDVHVARLRRKLGAEHRQVIRTVRRVGYKYAPPAGR